MLPPGHHILYLWVVTLKTIISLSNEKISSRTRSYVRSYITGMIPHGIEQNRREVKIGSIPETWQPLVVTYLPDTCNITILYTVFLEQTKAMLGFWADHRDIRRLCVQYGNAVRLLCGLFKE